MANVNDYYSTESSWLKGDDLPKGQEIKVTIGAVEEITFKEGEKSKLALKFDGKDKGVVLNKTNAGRIADVHGFDTDGWLGKEVYLYSEPVEFNGQMVRAVRLRVAMAETFKEDDIPF